MTDNATESAGRGHAGYRAERLRRFLELTDPFLKEKSVCRVLDVGGTRNYWLDLKPMWNGRNLDITVVNLADDAVKDDRFTVQRGDATSMPEFADNAFDVVHSNSVIEHVGRWKQMSAMAREVRRLAPRYFVQTPNYWFPYEPHFRSLFFHWLPEPMRVNKAMRRRLGSFPIAPTIDDAQRYIEDSILLDAKRFMHLFPDARLDRERVYGFTKSLIAIR